MYPFGAKFKPFPPTCDGTTIVEIIEFVFGSITNVEVDVAFVMYIFPFGCKTPPNA